MKSTTFIFQVIVSLGLILGVLGYTAMVAKAFMVTPNQVLQVIQK